MRIIEFILQRPVGTLMLCLGLTLGGIWSTFTMRLDFLPDFTVPKLTVAAAYKGLPAEEIRQLITIPLEDSLSSLGGLQNMSSISRDGLALIELEFPWGTDSTSAGIRTREAIDIAWLNLPSGASKPQVLAVDPGNIPIITIVVYPKNGNLCLARRLAERELSSMLQRIEGVGSIQLSGGYVEEVHIEADPDILASRGYTLTSISNILETSNIDYPAGTITEGSTDYLVKTKAEADSIEALGNLFLPSSDDKNNTGQSSIQLKDAAALSYGTKEQSSFFLSGFSSEEDRTLPTEGVRLTIRRQAGYSPRQTAENISKELERIQTIFSRDLDIEIIEDRSIILRGSMKNLILSLIYGACFAFLVLLIFMRNLSKSLILLVSLPSSLLWAILFLNIAGKSLNLMSLGGLALGVGMVVDNSIVVTERLSRTQFSPSVIAHLAPALCGSTITTIIVFAPLLFIDGLTGSLFGDLGLSIIIALASSLIISLTAVPVLYMLLKPESDTNDEREIIFRILRKLIRKSLRHPAIVFFSAAVLCIAGLIPLKTLPVEIVQPLNEGRLNCIISLPPGTGLQSVKRLGKEAIIRCGCLTSLSRIYAWAGGENNDPYYVSSTLENTESLQLCFTFPVNNSKESIEEELRKILKLQGGTLIFTPGENLLAAMLGSKQDTDWIIKGNSPEAAITAAKNVIDHINTSKPNRGVLQAIPAAEKPLLRLYPDRESLAAVGITLPELSRQLSNALYGTVPTSLMQDSRKIDVKLRIIDKKRDCCDDILNIELPVETEGAIRAGTLVSLNKEYSPPYLLRENRKDISIIRISNPSSDYKRILLKAGAEPRNVSVISRQSGELLTMLIMAFLLLYLCLGIQFESFSLPILLMTSIPPGAAGIVTALFLGGISVNLNSCLGILAVMGISVNNGILLYEESCTMMKRKMAIPAAALYKGTCSRLRPILITSLTTITALFPIALDPHGTSSQAGLALSIIGGLTSSTIISLILTPHILLMKLRKIRK